MMDRLPPRAGWAWLKEGVALFRKQPFEILMLLMTSLLLMAVVSFIPALGPVLRTVLTPVLSMAFMQACVEVEQGRRVYPTLLLTGFRSPARTRLLLLGALYLGSGILAIAASALVDGGLLWRLLTGAEGVNEEALRETNARLGLLFAALVFTPAAMALWYAAPLVMWQNMSVGKALFYSFFAVKRNALAFLVYLGAGLLVTGLLPAMLMELMTQLFGNNLLIRLLKLMFILVIPAIWYCSFYPTYSHVFGRRGDPKTAPPQLEA